MTRGVSSSPASSGCLRPVRGRPPAAGRRSASARRGSARSSARPRPGRTGSRDVGRAGARPGRCHRRDARGGRRRRRPGGDHDGLDLAPTQYRVGFIWDGVGDRGVREAGPSGLVEEGRLSDVSPDPQARVAVQRPDDHSARDQAENSKPNIAALCNRNSSRTACRGASPSTLASAPRPRAGRRREGAPPRTKIIERIPAGSSSRTKTTPRVARR